MLDHVTLLDELTRRPLGELFDHLLRGAFERHFGVLGGRLEDQIHHVEERKDQLYREVDHIVQEALVCFVEE